MKTPDATKRALVTCTELVMPKEVQHQAMLDALAYIQQLERERDAAVKALVLVSEKVEQAQRALDTDIVHYVDFDIYLSLRNMVDDILSWQHEDEQRGVKEE